MRALHIIIIIAIAFACNTKEKEKESEYKHVIKADDMVRVVEEGQLKGFIQFINTMGFHFRDTVRFNSGAVKYNCKDSLGRNRLFGILDKNLLLITLSLSTEDKKLFDKIDENLEKEGFYLNDDPLVEKLVKKGSLVEVDEYIQEGGSQPRSYQIVFSRRQ